MQRNAILHQKFPIHHGEVHRLRLAEDKRRHGIVHGAARMPDVVEGKGNDIGGHARRQGADVVAAEHGCPAQRGNFQRLTRRHRARVAQHPLQEQALAHLV